MLLDYFLAQNNQHRFYTSSPQSMFIPSPQSAVHVSYLIPVLYPQSVFHTQSTVRSSQSAVHILYGPIFRPIQFRKTPYFLVSRQNIELKKANTNSLIEFIKISETFKAKSSAGRISLRFNKMLPGLDYGPLAKLHLLFSYLDFRVSVSGLLSSRILQNNLLDLYLVQIRRYKLSFFAKAKAVTVGQD